MNPATTDLDEPTSETFSEVGLGAQLLSFNRAFWICNAMEMFERLAYYGLRTVLPVYMVLAVEKDGPQFDHTQKGAIFGIWAAVQSFVPIFSGGYADKYGFKLTIAVSIAIKILGYLVMAFAVDLAALTSGGESGGVPGHPHTYWWFLAGAVALAAGTAVFKPGLQGIIALQLHKQNDSVGWAVFYQLVNVGGFLGPFLAGVMRLMAWRWVFVSCAAVVAVNYLLLLTFTEPGVRKGWEGAAREVRLFAGTLVRSALGICEPRLMAFLVVFSGFWMMYYQLFDLLPNYIDDWVDSRSVHDGVLVPVFSAFGASTPAEWGGMVPQEWMINLNAGMCMLLAFVVGYFTGKVRSMTAMVAGILISAGAIYGLGLSPDGWMCLLFIAAFSFGELSASPTKLRYFSSIAPPEKKGLYLGYVNATVGIGWALGSSIAGKLYEEGGDKVVLARRYLVEVMGQSPDVVKDLPKTGVLPRLGELFPETRSAAASFREASALVEAAEKAETEAAPEVLARLDEASRAIDAVVRPLLYGHYDPSTIWDYFAVVGLVSMVGMFAFDRITRLNHRHEAFLLVALTAAVSCWTYGWGWAAAFAGAMLVYEALRRAAPQVLP